MNKKASLVSTNRDKHEEILEKFALNRNLSYDQKLNSSKIDGQNHSRSRLSTKLQPIIGNADISEKPVPKNNLFFGIQNSTKQLNNLINRCDMITDINKTNFYSDVIVRGKVVAKRPNISNVRTEYNAIEEILSQRKIELA